jgi:hypothetical protein
MATADILPLLAPPNDAQSNQHALSLIDGAYPTYNALNEASALEAYIKEAEALSQELDRRVRVPNELSWIRIDLSVVDEDLIRDG